MSFVFFVSVTLNHCLIGCFHQPFTAITSWHFRLMNVKVLLSDSILTLMEFLYKILFMMSEQVQ